MSKDSGMGESQELERAHKKSYNMLLDNDKIEEEAF